MGRGGALGVGKGGLLEMYRRGSDVAEAFWSL